MGSPLTSDEEGDYHHLVFYISCLDFLDSGILKKKFPACGKKICLLLQLPLSRLGELNERDEFISGC
jgi:hypothetical protein